MLINHELWYAFRLKCCGNNYAAIFANYASFLLQNYFSDLSKDMYCKTQNMNNPKYWYTPYLLQINIGASGLQTKYKLMNSTPLVYTYMWYTRAVLV